MEIIKSIVTYHHCLWMSVDYNHVNQRGMFLSSFIEIHFRGMKRENDPIIHMPKNVDPNPIIFIIKKYSFVQNVFYASLY